jgi:signal transduction histidine kinase
LQSTEFTIDFEDVCIRDALRDAVRTMTPLADKKGVSLPCPEANTLISTVHPFPDSALSTAQPLPDSITATTQALNNPSVYVPPIPGDYGRLKQLFVIFLDNAIKFSSAGNSIAVELVIKEEGLSVTVRDEGTGISETDLPHIFERFYRKKAKDNHIGTGLGLPIAKQIADRHGARIHVASEPGCGTTVEILFKI